MNVAKTMFNCSKSHYEIKLKSSRSRDKISFHTYLANALNVERSDVVLDLGCGYGNTMIYVAPYLSTGKIIGIDCDEQQLGAAQKILSKEIKKGIVQLRMGDLSKDLTCKNNSIDKIVSHNVIECVESKEAMIDMCYDWLRPSGKLIFSHCDFDTQVYNSAFPALTRDLVHNYCDSNPGPSTSWDGWIGRRLCGLFSRSKFKQFHSEVYVMTSRSFSNLDYGYSMAKEIIIAAKRSKRFKLRDLSRWIADLSLKNKNKDYFYSININLIHAIKHAGKLSVTSHESD